MAGTRHSSAFTPLLKTASESGKEPKIPVCGCGKLHWEAEPCPDLVMEIWIHHNKMNTLEPREVELHLTPTGIPHPSLIPHLSLIPPCLPSTREGILAQGSQLCNNRTETSGWGELQLGDGPCPPVLLRGELMDSSDGIPGAGKGRNRVWWEEQLCCHPPGHPLASRG